LATAPANDEPLASPGKKRRYEYPFWWGRAMWTVNVIALVGIFCWILVDAKFPATARHAQWLVEVLRGNFHSLPDDTTMLGRRPTILSGLLVAGTFTLPAIFATLLGGNPRHRSLRAWFAFTLLVAAWLTLFVSWREFAWQGQRMRLWTRLDNFEPIAAELQGNWPQGDGELPKVGTFMAYPQGKPRTLLMLAQPASQSVAFSAIERDDDGSLKFELAGDETGAWLEWHPAGSAPDNFTGGLENNYIRGRSAPLGNGWYLVRYR
jgi:hypothetical protein